MLDRQIVVALYLPLALATSCAVSAARRDPALMAEAKAVEFLQREVPAWSRENGCYSCHNNGDAARALYAASRRGHRVSPRSLADTTAWITRPDQWDHNKGDPGFSDQRLANIQFAASLAAAAETRHVSTTSALQEAARRVAKDQDTDGSWPVEPHNPAGSPATYGTWLATYMAVRTLRAADAAGSREAILRAERWMSQRSPGTVVAAAASLLATASTALPDAAIEQRRMEDLDFLRRTRNRDGGWGPYPDSPSEPFDTALVLIALREVSPRHDLDSQIQQGRDFLIRQQQEDGSWPATTRPPGGESYAQRLSTTGWATLALLAARTNRPNTP